MSFISGLAGSNFGNDLNDMAGKLAAPTPAPKQGVPTQLPTDFHPMADPSHPFWNALGGIITGQPQPDAPQQSPIAPAPQQSPIPVQSMAPAAAPAPAPQMLQTGGVVEPAFTRGPALPTGPNSGIVPASTEGQILTMDAGGVVPDGFTNPMGGPTPPVSGRAAGFAQGLAQGQVMGRNLRNSINEHRARQDAANYADQVVGIDADHPDASSQTQQPSMLDRAKDAVEGFFHHLHSGTLNDQHTPNGGTVPQDGSTAVNSQPTPVSAQGSQQAIPTGASAPAAPSPPGAPATPAAGASGQPAAAASPVPTPQAAATMMAAKAASQDPASNAGIPQQSPEDSGKPHSLTSDYWQESQSRLRAAVRSAALAGEDPQKVYDSLTAMRTAHFQGQILRQLSAANTALLNGDEGSVKQALSNVNYYLPNGKGIEFRTATADDAAQDQSGQTKPGQLMYRNPMYGLYGHEGDQQYVSVTPQHLQLLGESALHPETVNDTIMKSYSAQAAAKKGMIQAQGSYNVGLGRLAQGEASKQRAQNETEMMPVSKYDKFTKGNLQEAQAGYYNRKQANGTGVGPRVTLSNIQSAQKAAQTSIDGIFQGQMTTVPATDANGRPSLSPAAGRSIHDATRIPTIFQGMSPDQQDAVRQYGGELAAANVGVLDPSTTADMAARLVKFHGNKVPPTHLDPQTHQPVKDVIYDVKNNTVHVWVGNGWKNAYIQPNVIDQSDRGSGIPTGGSDDEGSGDNEGGGE